MMNSREPNGIAAKLLDFGRRPIPITRRQSLALVGALITAGGLGAVWHFNRFALRNAIALNLWVPTPFDHESGFDRLRASAEAIRPLFIRKGEPVRGEWLALFDEPGQSLNQYLRGFTPALRAANGAILILPFGEFETRLTAIVNEVVALLDLFYERRVQILPVEPAPPLAADQRRGSGTSEQLFTLPLLDYLKTRVPADAAALLAMTPVDVTAGPNWNFVFGQASLVDRVGVWSLSRLAERAAPPALQLRRVSQVALHELGHMFGLWHCTAYSCCMNGFDSMKELDAAPLAFCPECDAKVWWRFGLEPAPRYTRLAEFARARGLERDADLWARCARALMGARV